MTTAFLPAQMLHVASKFVSPDPTKGCLTGIYVCGRGDLPGVEIVSTNGHSMIRITCKHERWECSEPLLIRGDAFAKRAPYAKWAQIDSSEGDAAKIMGGRKIAEHMQTIPWQWRQSGTINDSPAQSYPNYQRLWPDHFGHYDPSETICFDPKLLSDFLKFASMFDASNVEMHRNASNQPMLFTADFQPGGDEYEANVGFLLMPIVKRK